MLYFLITTSLYNNSVGREKQYINGINTLKEVIQNMDINPCKIIIIENNGIRKTFLNTLGCEIYYTNNNKLLTRNIGYKELKDIHDCITNYNISDDDFIVKMTGRYVLNNNSEFMNKVKEINNTSYDCIIRYGSFITPVNYKMNDCITGLIGMRCKYVKQIELPKNMESVEWNWAKATNLIENSKICIVNKLGIKIAPKNSAYYEV